MFVHRARRYKRMTGTGDRTMRVVLPRLSLAEIKASMIPIKLHAAKEPVIMKIQPQIEIRSVQVGRAKRNQRTGYARRRIHNVRVIFGDINHFRLRRQNFNDAVVLNNLLLRRADQRLSGYRSAAKPLH
jgi:hypothetical protein